MSVPAHIFSVLPETPVQGKEEIMSKKTVGYAVIVLGIAVLALSLGADAIGIGSSPGIGWKQLAGAAIGIIIALGGLYLTFNRIEQGK